MDEKILFEIPIYSMPEDVFEGRWKRQTDKMYEDFLKSGHTPESAREGIYRCCYPKTLWRYNQIIGYITVSVSSNDVWFNVFCSMDKAYRFDSSTKHFIEDWSIGGCHFYVRESDTNEDIKEQIWQWLGSIQKDHLKGKYYIDFSTFKNVFQYVDVRQAISDLQNSKKGVKNLE